MYACLMLLVCLLTPSFAASSKSETIQGKLTQREGQPPAIQTAGRGLVALEGDEATTAVIKDKRLNGMDMEAHGHFVAPDRFAIDPIHTKAMLVHKDGRLKMITYWCELCAIRTYSPGVCWCCQKETVLDLRDPDQQ